MKPPGNITFFRERECLIRVVFLFALAAAVYLPVFKAGYIWDDQIMLTENRFVQADDGLAGIWSGRTVDYLPVTFTFFWIEWRLFGNNPAGYHVINVLWHALAAVFLWRVLLRLKIPGAWLAVLIRFGCECWMRIKDRTSYLIQGAMIARVSICESIA